MISYNEMTKDELRNELKGLREKYDEYKALDYNLNMSRGKPCKEQLDLSSELLSILGDNNYKAADGFDLRNYGILDGIPEAKKLFAEVLSITPDKVIVGGNSSLNLMYDTISRAMLFGVPGSEKPWSKQENVKFLCPVPGYDRHFGVTKEFGIEMINIAMTSEGPDMDEVEKLVLNDSSIKGIWCVPLYSNPDGITYSEDTCKRFAEMKTAAPDFRIMWDNAYGVHHLSDENFDSIPDIIDLCEKAGNPDRAFVFASTSKITWAGAGISCIASSLNNVSYIKSHINFQTIGSDKINQLRHVAFLKNYDNIKLLMKKHADILKPKFEAVFKVLHQNLQDAGIASWNEPKGGYFISLYVQEGTAKRVVSLCKECGVELTPAGATFPYSRDPKDNNIRIAPTFPPVGELIAAIEILCVCAKIASVEKLIEN